jgi:hypothetical protein
MSKHLEVTINGIDKAADWLKDYAEHKLKAYCEELITRMLREGEVTARILLTHVDTGNTLSTIMGYREGNTGMILAGGNAIWIEFGTGIVANNGAAYPNPAAEDLNMDAIGTYGRGHGSDLKGWFYKDEYGEWKHTFGIPANMFMYNTAQMLRREYAKMAKEIFSK